MQYTLATMMAAAALLPSAMAHYNFDKLIVDGVTTEAYEYIRRMTNSNSPVTDVTSNDMRCNVGTQANAASTKTYPVKAGAEVGFTVADVIGHPGPLMVYLSKAPGAAAEYDGSGDWFKIFELGVKEFATETTSLKWETDGWKNFTITLPTEIEDGEYLLRAEHLGIHGSGELGGGQFYISCAQIAVTGGAGGSPSPLVKIPGVYTATDPGIYFQPYWPPVTNYTIPGPAVYGSSTGSGNNGGAASSAAPVATAAPTATPVSSEVPATPTTFVTLTRSATEEATPAPTAVVPVETPVEEEDDEDCE